jgi:predicted heme/steroid binding protein
MVRQLGVRFGAAHECDVGQLFFFHPLLDDGQHLGLHVDGVDLIADDLEKATAAILARTPGTISALASSTYGSPRPGPARCVRRPFADP